MYKKRRKKLNEPERKKFESVDDTSKAVFWPTILTRWDSINNLYISFRSYVHSFKPCSNHGGELAQRGNLW